MDNRLEVAMKITNLLKKKKKQTVPKAISNS
jgi:hypothetical protein